jgi:phosphatidylserine/phosphatidylglycerophosphate/cardiolipin synthase-like enzyme
MSYFPPPSVDCPTFAEDSDWHPLIDGEPYLGELAAHLDAVGPGDSVLISGLAVDPMLDLADRRPGEPGFLSLVERLARLAADGVQVRVLVAGKVVASSIPLPAQGDLRENVRRARVLRQWRPVGSDEARPPPLADCVLVDYSGALLGSNHQKVVVFCRSAEVTAYVGGIDLTDGRFDASPHGSMLLNGARWGWHDAVVRLRGPAAAYVQLLVTVRWREASTLPARRRLNHSLRLELINPSPAAAAPAPPPPQPAVPNPGTAVRVVRAIARTKVDSPLPWRRVPWESLPATGIHEVFQTLAAAMDAAQRYIYLEDQYLQEYFGGPRRFELYPYLLAAARRGVKVIMVGSGVRDPADPGIYLRPINRRLNRDLRNKIINRLGPRQRDNVAVFRVEHLTVHAKMVLVDDAFACIGSANMFSRSMGGVDNELSTAVETTTPLVRDLRVRVWAEHLRAPMSADLQGSLEDLDLALGIWNPRWLVAGTPLTTWRAAGQPLGFHPSEFVLRSLVAN